MRIPLFKEEKRARFQITKASTPVQFLRLQSSDFTMSVYKKLTDILLQISNNNRMIQIMEALLCISIILAIHLMVRFIPKSKKVQGKHIVVTGGSSGIGLHLAIFCARKGANVTIIARNIHLLESAIKRLEVHRQNPDQKFTYRSLDISKDYEEVAECLSEIEETIGPIYMLVNCAGLAICGVFEEISIEDAKKLMDVNYYGTYYCTRYVLPKMKAAREGIIVITGSQASLLGIYGYGPYAATKFALRGLAETIAMESKHLGVSVTLALPCDTNTPGFEEEEKSKPIETKIISGSGGLARPESVAKKIFCDAIHGSFFSILGAESWIVTILCCGMAPWGGILFNFFQAFLMGPFRIVSIAVRWKFNRIIRNCALQKTN